MKIGIFAYRQYPYISANTSIAYAVGNEIVKQGHEVVHIGYRQDLVQNDIKAYNHCEIEYINQEIIQKRNIFEKIAVKIAGNKFRLRKESAMLREIVNRQHIDALLCIIAPLENILITYFADLDIPIYLYQLDPFFNNKDIEDLKLKKLFIEILGKIKYLFTTDLLYQAYLKDQQLSMYLDRMSVLQFPKLIQKEISDHVAKTTDEKNVKLLYAGTLYKSIRSPKILLNLKDVLPKNCEIIFCGSCDDLTEQKTLEEKGIICKGYCSQEIVEQEMNNADILINIGNKVTNQLGSKIIDYLSLGKPILNITQIKDCPTEKILADYKYKLNISTEMLIKKEIKEILAEFVHNSKNQRMTWEELENIYKCYTPQYVSQQILNQMIK